MSLGLFGPSLGKSDDDRSPVDPSGATSQTCGNSKHATWPRESLYVNEIDMLNYVPLGRPDQPPTLSRPSTFAEPTTNDRKDQRRVESARLTIRMEKTPNRYSFPCSPLPKPASVVTGGSDGSSFYRFTLLTDRLVRFEWSQDGGFEDRVSTFAMFREFETPKFSVNDSKSSLEISTDYFQLKYDKRRFSEEGLSVRVGTDVWRYDGKSYGDLGGTARTLDRAAGRIPLDPGVLSRRAYAVLDDSESMLFDDKGWIAVRTPGRVDGYLFAYAGDHKAAIKDFYRLSGHQPVLPRWALGNWWSRYHEYSEKEYLALMDRFSSEDIPLNVGIVDMDWHKVNIPPQYGSGWTGYSWNRDLFPNPERFLEELHKRKLKTALNDHPADGIRAFEDAYPEVARAMGKDPARGEAVEFDCTDKKFLDVYFDILKTGLEKQGVDFWWIDWQQGNRSRIPGVDPLWVLNHYHYLTSYRNLKVTQNPITFSRFAGPGSHRYPIGFSGDTLITWDALHFQPEFTATASNIGYGWWSHDIGGHYAGVRSNELTVRWVQLGVFSPINRLHSSKSAWNSKEPWNFERQSFLIMKHFLIFRHRLIPFLYTMNIRAAYEDEPLVQPMYWNHTDEAAYTVPNQYYFGPDLMVAPITSPNSRTTLLGSVRAWLPRGRYIDLLHRGLVYDGDRYIRLHRDLTTIPVLAKEGTILPLDGATTVRNGAQRPVNMEILLVVGADAEFTLVEEPLSTPPADHGGHLPLSAYVRTHITWNQAEGVLSIMPDKHGDTLAQVRRWTVCLVGYTGDQIHYVPQRTVTREKGYTKIVLGTLLANQYMPERNSFFLGRNLQLDTVDVTARLRETLFRAEMDYDMKDVVWNVVIESRDPIERRVQIFRELNIDASLKDAIMEIWAADSRSDNSAIGHEVWSFVEPPPKKSPSLLGVEPDVGGGYGWDAFGADDYIMVSKDDC